MLIEHRIDGELVASYDAPEVPRVLSKTAFQDLSVSLLGGGITGMSRFMEILDAAKTGSGAVKFCHQRYSDADTFNKSGVDQFTQIMVGANVMTSNERTSILDGWPSA